MLAKTKMKKRVSNFWRFFFFRGISLGNCVLVLFARLLAHGPKYLRKSLLYHHDLGFCIVSVYLSPQSRKKFGRNTGGWGRNGSILMFLISPNGYMCLCISKIKTQFSFALIAFELPDMKKWPDSNASLELPLCFPENPGIDARNAYAISSTLSQEESQALLSSGTRFGIITNSKLLFSTRLLYCISILLWSLLL